ncbi:MAG: hypothetical protein JST16_17145 [Bdellovibrionales bacterium]|nr:hypothetical protein [Bdellovibrionales bacterium]
MIQIVFKDLERSELARDILLNRLTEALSKFPDLDDHRLVLTLSCENSAFQPGPDLFGVKLHVRGPKFPNLLLEKKSANLYIAAADLNEALLELLNRARDKSRVKNRARARKHARHSQSLLR